MTNFLLGCLVGLLLGTTFSAKAQMSMYDVPLGLQSEIDHWQGIQDELNQPDIPLPHYTFPELPCDRR